ncbi:MAG TPA: class I lanthipeptide [Actinomycetota bacterium]|nr:class I lanthipeptide [Actinomycetota bacterium]
MAKKLELHKETLRGLTDEALTEVAGGVEEITTVCGHTQTPLCPSGATWFSGCS